MAVHRVRQWVSGNSGKFTQETLFRESFNKGSQARQALEHAFDDAAPQLFDEVVAGFVGGVPKGAKGETVQELVSGLLLSGLKKNPGLQDLLANLATEAPKGSTPAGPESVPGGGGKSQPVSEATYAYNAVAMLGLEPAIRRRLAAGGISADQRAALREMKDALVNLRLGTGAQTRQLTDWFATLKNPGADSLNSHNAKRLQAASGNVKLDVEKAVAVTTQTLKGARIFLGPEWAAARASLSDAIRLGAGDALRNFVNHAAAEAVQQGRKGADLAVFMAGKLGAAPLESIVPHDSQLGKLLAEVQKMAPEGEARNHAVSNLLLVCGISEAARASTSLTSGKHRDALKVMAAVAQGMAADGRPGALTRWLGPAKTEALTKAMKDGALAFRNTLSSGDFRRDSQVGGPEDPTVFYTDQRGSGPRGSSSSSASSSGSSTPAAGDFQKPGTPSSSDSEGSSRPDFESKASVRVHSNNASDQVGASEQVLIHGGGKSSVEGATAGGVIPMAKRSNEEVANAISEWRAKANTASIKKEFLDSDVKSVVFAFLDDAIGSKLDVRAQVAIRQGIKVGGNEITSDTVDEILNTFEQGSGNASLGKSFRSVTAQPVMAALRAEDDVAFAVDVLLEYCCSRFAQLPASKGVQAAAQEWVKSTIRSIADNVPLSGIPKNGLAPEDVPPHFIAVSAKVRRDLTDVVRNA